MRRSRLPLLAGGLLLALLMLWLAAGGRAQRDADVVIARGSSLASAAETLERAGAIRSARELLFRERLFGPRGAIRPGEYLIKRGTSARDILRLLQSGRVVQRFVVVPEGLPAVLVQERLANAPFLTGPAPLPPEGSVLPDSYAYTRGEPRAAVLRRMEAAMTRTLARLWAARKPASAVTNPRDAVILASIIEKETGVPGERRMVAAVYTNRLKLGMPLQADPTLIYPVTKGKPLGRRILRSEINADTPYNSYRRRGLPPTPITNPGRASIAAALDPAPSKALYFVAKGNGSSVFAETLAEHNANVANWYKLRRERGEM